MTRPTIKTIAKLTGYSIATVSKALKNDPAVKEKTQKKITETAAEIGYVANLDGLKLRTGRTYRIAVLITTPQVFSNEWEGVEFTHILSGVSKALEGTPYQLSVHPTKDFDDCLKEVKEIVEQRKADGLILSGTRPDDQRISYLLEKKFPFVSYGMSEHFTPYPYVDTDSERTANQATKRLINKGHKRIALINPSPELMYAQQRSRGYSKALQENDIAVDQDLIASGTLSSRFGKESVEYLHNLKAPPTAYICANEASALGVLSAFHEKGIVYGKDAVVIATDDINVSEYFTPPLTTYFLPIEETSRTLGEFLLRHIAGEAVENLQKKIMPELIERNSDQLSL